MKTLLPIETTNNVAILVVSCDSYQDLWQPFFKCFFKYWPDCPYPIYLGTNTICYTDAKVKTILVGKDRDYSTNLLAMLEKVKEDWVVFWIEDRVLSAPVDTNRISRLITQAIFEEAVFLKLISSHPYSFTNKLDDIGEIPAGNKYRVCMTVALWKKDFLKKLLVPGESAWDIERAGSVRSNGFLVKFLSLNYSNKNNPPICDKHLIIKGRLLRESKVFLSNENLLDELKNRETQSLYSYIYVQLYLLVKDLIAYFTHLTRK